LHAAQAYALVLKWELEERPLPPPTVLDGSTLTGLARYYFRERQALLESLRLVVRSLAEEGPAVAGGGRRGR
jgi:hypothetical protein